MKTLAKTYVILFITLFTIYPLQANSRYSNNQEVWAVLNNAAISEQEADTLIFMREEEKLARDIYITLFNLWDNPVFDNISSAEQRHMESLKSLLDNYNLVDPIQDDTVGIFTNEKLATLYEDLSKQGAASLTDAFYVGALIEELDILDLQQAIAESIHTDVVASYENLMRGSRNHLRAFVRQIESLGLVYDAQLMNQNDVDAIVDSNFERGRQRGGRR